MDFRGHWMEKRRIMNIDLIWRAGTMSQHLDGVCLAGFLLDSQIAKFFFLLSDATSDSQACVFAVYRKRMKDWDENLKVKTGTHWDVRRMPEQWAHAHVWGLLFKRKTSIVLASLMLRVLFICFPPQSSIFTALFCKSWQWISLMKNTTLCKGPTRSVGRNVWLCLQVSRVHLGDVCNRFLIWYADTNGDDWNCNGLIFSSFSLVSSNEL